MIIWPEIQDSAYSKNSPSGLCIVNGCKRVTRPIDGGRRLENQEMEFFMKFLHITILVCLAGTVFLAHPSRADEVRLKNGDRLTGTVISMEKGKLTYRTAYAGVIKIPWSEIAGVKTDDAVFVTLNDDTTLKGTTQPAEHGKMKLKMGKIVETVSFDLSEVKAIGLKAESEKSKVKLKGHLNIGANRSTGNTNTSSIHMDGEIVARSGKNRYTAGGQFNQSKSEGQLSEDNVLGYMKYDYFFKEKWFLYNAASFEKDEFQDLSLRTIAGAGVGYQFYETPEMNLSLESGLSYVDENRKRGVDDNYLAGRWALNFDKYFLDDAVQFFHFHEGLVSLESTSDILIRSRTGLRVPVYKNLQSTLEYDLDWNSEPAPGVEETDQRYILSLGYTF